MIRRFSLLSIVVIMLLALTFAVSADNLESSLAVDTTVFFSSDGQPLIVRGVGREIPVRPQNPRSLPETDPLHWWDIEYAGWNVEKVNMPVSPNDGAIGKSVILIRAGDHPYWTSYVNGFRVIADAYDWDLKIFNSNWNMDLQSQQTDQAINERPDMVIMAPVDATASTILFRRINQAGIPVIASNTIPTDEAMRFVISWTGPDDWGQFRKLARAFADEMGREGGYVIVRHMPGASPFFARTFAPITELGEYAPDMKLLAMETANLEAEGTMELVSSWLTMYGDELKGIISAGDGPSMTGIVEALRNARRDDVIVVAAGNSQTGMGAVQEGNAFALTYQTAEGDGALAAQTAADWFNGFEIDPVMYLPMAIITEDNVEDFLPAQW